MTVGRGATAHGHRQRGIAEWADEAYITVDDVLARLHPAWHRLAACRGMAYKDGAPDFFPDRGRDLRPAKSICATCPVTADCVASALSDAWTSGVWGGTSERGRRRLRGVMT